jgi:hypothetical protein
MSLLRLVECLECICKGYHVLLSPASRSPEARGEVQIWWLQEAVGTNAK